MFDSATSVPQVKAGKLRALAVVGPNRVSALPDVPTFKELGVEDMEVANGWYAVVTTKGTPHNTVHRLNKEIVQILEGPPAIDAITSMGLEPAISTPEELSAKLRDDLKRLGLIVQKANIALE